MKKKENIVEDIPIATEILRDYKKTVQDYKNYNKSLIDANKRMTTNNKRMTIIILILIILLAIACTYIILTWDICDPTTGLFKNTC